MDRVAVRLNRNYDKYNAGEVAGFDADVSRKLVQKGWANYLDTKPSGGTKAEAPAEESTPEAEAEAATVEASDDEEKPSGGTKRKRRRKSQ